MVDVEQLVDPELEGLLRELASRPRSVFLRSSRKEALRVLRSRTTDGISALAVPDALERELVIAHRDELAEILKQACRTKLLEGEREKLFVMRYRTATERVDPMPLGRIRSRFERARGCMDEDPWAGEISSIAAALSVRTEQDLSVLDLAALGQKLQPGDTWRVMGAYYYNSNGLHADAGALGHAVLSGMPSAAASVQALEALALAEVATGRPKHALEFQEQAMAIVGPYPLGEVNRLRCSMIILDADRVLDSSRTLDTMLSPQHPLIVQSCAADAVQLRLGLWQPSPDSCELSVRLESRLGAVAREVSRAFH